MNTNFPHSETDPILAAVLAAGEPGAPGWEKSLPPDDHPEAMVWSAIACELADALKMESRGLGESRRMVILNESHVQVMAGGWSELDDELAGALRMGPGGLTDAQRAAILEAAAHPAAQSGVTRTIPAGRSSRSAIRPWWKWSIAAGIAATLTVVATRHIARDDDVAGGTPVARVSPDGQSPPNYRLRVLPGATSGSRYLSGHATRRMAALKEHDASAVASTRGFQPVALANMAEFIPMPAPFHDVALADLILADATPGGPWFAALINHFDYAYPQPSAGEVLSLSVEAGPCPWQPANRLVHIGLRAGVDPNPANGRHGIVASDVRMVVDFNPRKVAAYRLIGNGPDDRGRQGDRVVTAGAELPAGQMVAAIYEIVPADNPPSQANGGAWPNAGGSGADSHDQDILAAKVVFRQPGDTQLSERSVVLGGILDSDAEPSADFQFSAAVAAFALLRERAPGMQHFGMNDALALARAGVGADPDGRRGEFIQLLTGQTN